MLTFVSNNLRPFWQFQGEKSQIQLTQSDAVKNWENENKVQTRWRCQRSLCLHAWISVLTDFKSDNFDFFFSWMNQKILVIQEKHIACRIVYYVYFFIIALCQLIHFMSIVYVHAFSQLILWYLKLLMSQSSCTGSYELEPVKFDCTCIYNPSNTCKVIKQLVSIYFCYFGPE